MLKEKKNVASRVVNVSNFRNFMRNLPETAVYDMRACFNSRNYSDKHVIFQGGDRRLINDYEIILEHILAGLSAEKLPTAVELAQLPDQIRGYAYVKDQSLVEVSARKDELMAEFAA